MSYIIAVFLFLNKQNYPHSSVVIFLSSLLKENSPFHKVTESRTQSFPTSPSYIPVSDYSSLTFTGLNLALTDPHALGFGLVHQ